MRDLWRWIEFILLVVSLIGVPAYLTLKYFI